MVSLGFAVETRVNSAERRGDTGDSSLNHTSIKSLADSSIKLRAYPALKLRAYAQETAMLGTNPTTARSTRFVHHFARHWCLDDNTTEAPR